MKEAIITAGGVKTGEVDPGTMQSKKAPGLFLAGEVLDVDAYTGFKPSKVKNVCDKCGGELYQRDDDKVETVKKRLSVYAAQTKPLIDYYKNSNLYIEIDGKQSMEDVYKDIVASLEKSK